MAEDVFGIVGTTQAGNFRVEKVVAEGGFAVVYRALHGGFRAPVAIKCLKIPEQMDPKMRDVFLEKFREEAELMFRLSAAIAEICRPLHVDVLHLPDGRFVPFLALEWLNGESLDGIVTRRREQGQPPLGLHKVVKMMRPIAGALAKAHRFPGPDGAVCIIHRDLKPENLFLANIHGVETMKILDYGIAKAKRAATQAAGRVTGKAVAEDEMASFTPAYGSPEQWQPKTWGESGPWTDVWGLALSMTEALCGHPPLDGEQWAMRRACLDQKRRPTPRAHGADVPIAVEEVFEMALALDPRRRFKSVEAFWTALEKSMGLAPTLVSRDDRREPSGSDTDAAPAPPKPGVQLAQVPLKKVSAAALEKPAAPPLRVPKPSVAMGVQSSVSGDWELDLAAETAASASSDLEMSLPIAGEPTPAASAHDGSLELSLPTRSDPPPAGAAPPPAPAPPPPAAPAPPPPTAAAPPQAEPPKPPAPEPAKAPPATRAPTDDNVDFDLDLAAGRSPNSKPTSSSSGTFAAPPLSGGAMGSSPSYPRPNPPLSPHLAQPWRRPPSRSVMSRLGSPLAVLLLALAVASSEIGYKRFTGGELSFGGIRPFYLAAPLALIGVAFTLWRLMEDRDDG